MHIDWWTLGLQALNVGVLLWIFSRFLFRPVADIVRKRQEAADAVLAQAEASRAAALAHEAEAQVNADRLSAERGRVMADAEAQARATAEAILSDANRDAARIRADAEAAAVALKEAEMTRLATEASRLSLEITRKLLARLPSELLVSGFLDGLSEAVAHLPEETRAGMGNPDQPLILTAARQLTEAERQACQDMLERTLGRSVTLTTATDPSLLAGLELEASHALVRNSFRADLERIEARLIHHD